MREFWKQFRKWFSAVSGIVRWRNLLVKRMNDLSNDVDAQRAVIADMVRLSNRKSRRKFRRILWHEFGMKDRRASRLLESTYVPKGGEHGNGD